MNSLFPDSIAKPFGRYAHGTVFGGRILRTSGQLPLGRDGNVPQAVEAQTDLCFANIDAILKEGGMDRSHIVHLAAYVTRREDMAAYMSARDRYLVDIAPDSVPASTLMIVSGFTRPEFLVEIEAMAAIPDQK
ncbi:MAG: RidA family protein [Ahrensia sp.]|nr:RidA family protein [Ahrensia sp.]